MQLFNCIFFFLYWNIIFDIAKWYQRLLECSFFVTGQGCILLT